MGVRVRFLKRAITPEAIGRKMAAIDGLTLTVGVQGAKAAVRPKRPSNAVRRASTGNDRKRSVSPRVSAQGSVNMATIAMFNEFGTKDIPQRSFLRAALFEGRSKLNAVIADEMETYIAQPKRTAVTTLEAIGKFAASLVVTRINTTSHWAKPNAPSTVAAKGFDRPLHHTDRLSESISWAVRGPGGSIIAEGAAR